MKIKAEIYAQTLIATAKPANLKVIAKNIWHKLQKNKQYKDLPRIIEALDAEYAKANDLNLAKVYSENPLSDSEIKEISHQIQTRNYNQKYIEEGPGRLRH